jgi:hypothetical protein
MKPFGFTFGPGKNNRSIVLTEVHMGSAAAKAGLTVGMCLVSLNEVNVRDLQSTIVRKLLKTTDPRSIVLKFELPPPDTQPPGIYHVKHDSMVIASMIVGHIETFLDHTHEYEDPKMAETNPLLASLLNCNTNVQLVGSLSSAMSVLQYLSGYLSKNPIELCNFITCIIAARRRCKRYTSTAEDAGTQDRNAKFLAQKVFRFDHTRVYLYFSTQDTVICVSLRHLCMNNLTLTLTQDAVICVSLCHLCVNVCFLVCVRETGSKHAYSACGGV